MGNRPLVTGVQVVSVYVTDLERAHTFYTDVLGLTHLDVMPPGMLLRAGDVTIYLEGGRKRRLDPGMDGVTTSIAFGADSIRTAFDRLRAAGVPVVQELQVYGDQFAMFRVADPDGNVIEFAGSP